jgi:ribonucleoside-diphosphate reductase alpha chain
MTKQLLDYFNNDELSSSVWLGKYALKDGEQKIVETTPTNMHRRMANELARLEYAYAHSDRAKLDKFNIAGNLSPIGREISMENYYSTEEELADLIFSYLDRFKWIIPQGSIMSALGNKFKLQSLSNCFVVPAPYDSYGGIFKTDQEIAQLEKRRGGVGTNLNSLRPDDTPVLNAAGTSTGAHSFMDRYSNTTREVAQNGRRGALMLLMDIRHPDIYKFITKKKDRTKVTGANISTQLTNKFLQAVENDEDFYCRFPIDWEVSNDMLPKTEYNKLVPIQFSAGTKYIMRIKAKELFDLIVEMAWDNAEPGLAFMDTVINYSPEGVYAKYRPIASNPCGEQWMQAYDACRLLAANMFSFVVNPFKKDAYIDYDTIYRVFYMQQRYADLIVDLEIEYVNAIIAKIDSDPEPEDVKATERQLWVNVRDTAAASRRTGCGFTALADMIAALNLKYDSKEGMDVIKQVMKTKMRAELDCTIDLSILRGTFEGWDKNLEFTAYRSTSKPLVGKNSFYEMIAEEFPEQAFNMYKYGRRNVSWSTVAPTGSVSIIAILERYSNTSGGMEPVFMPFYFRNKKVNPSDKNARVDFVDQNGDSWQTYPVVMGGFKEWYYNLEGSDDPNSFMYGVNKLPIEELTKDQLQFLFEQSPYYGSCANDISWEKRIEIQGILQRYTTNAISSTLNLPKDVSKATVAGIYMAAWKNGLKGVTIYRDGCRTGVLVADNTKKPEGITYNDATKRPETLSGELSIVTVKGARYGVLIGFLENKPYEIFAFNTDKETKPCKGSITKEKKGRYSFSSKDGVLFDNIQSAAIHADEQMLTRLVSGMMRHGVNPKFIYEQISKCPLEIVSFGKAISRVIKKYIPEKELLEGQKCKDCGSTNIRLAEGCVTCNECGGSKCG